MRATIGSLIGILICTVHGSAMHVTITIPTMAITV
jgi:hypothetical protein